jgi:hypothetical protein
MRLLRTAEEFVAEVETTTRGYPRERLLEALQGQLQLVPFYATMPEEERQKAMVYLTEKISELGN